MKTSVLSLLALASSAYSLVLPRNACTSCKGFTITVGGGAKGPLGQLSDGQNRVGPDYGAAKYNFDCNGGKITDAKGRGCILTPPTTQFQCDVGATPTGGFSIGTNGQISYNGSTKFYACPPDNKGNYNIYTVPVKGQTKCVAVTLTANGCSAPKPPPVQTCPYSNVTPNGQSFEFPHLIVPVDSSQPDKKYGTVYSPVVNSKVSTIFNFDVRPGFSGKKCSLVLLFPNPPSSTSSYTFSGAGNLKITQRSSPATVDTTYKNQSGVSKDYGITKVSPGHSYTISTFACPAGQRIAYEIGTTDTSFTWFQDYNPAAIGLYITAC